uniref:Secreted protein n=1 Tax=Ascaris lumbricoides TaxID=6252 RepID=A0A0M3IGV4_ASCLU
MYVNCTYAALITRALAVAIIFAQSSAYSNPQRSSAPIVSSIISDYDDWKHLDDRQYFGSFDNNDKDNEDSETSEAWSISSLPLKRSGASRLCGNKLVEMIVKMCKGCVKPAGGKPVTAKRCEYFPI